nr:hypothetical protein [Tanacetum cinerariifolium]
MLWKWSGQLPFVRDPPEIIKELFKDRHFMESICAYNMMFFMTSFGANAGDSVNNGSGPYVFKVEGKISHLMGSLCPPPGQLQSELQETIYVSASVTIATGDPIPVTTPIAAGVSTTAGASGSASEAFDAPLRKSLRKKSIAKKRTLPSPSKPMSDALPFDEDEPEAAFKRYLRQASDDDEPAEPVSLALGSDITTWELIPTEFGRGKVHVISRADGIVKRFSTLRELMYWAERADLMVLYGLVLAKYKTKRAIARDIMHMFVDKKYPLTPETLQRMLNHGLEIDRDPFGLMSQMIVYDGFSCHLALLGIMGGLVLFTDFLKVCRALTMPAWVLNCPAFKLEEIVMAMMTCLKSSGVHYQCFTVKCGLLWDLRCATKWFQADYLPFSTLLVHQRFNKAKQRGFKDDHEGYHAVPPLYIGTFIPPKPDLVFTDDPTDSKSIANVFNVKSITHKPSKDMSKTYRPDAPIFEDWISDFKDKTEIEVMLKKPQHIGCRNQNGNQQQALKDKGVIDSGCSRHMTGNISFLSEFKEINGGYVAFGRNPKGGKISGKGKINTCKLDFDDVYFVKELKFNLFSVSQMCDKKNIVLFINTGCVILSSDHKLPDENHVLLRVTRENNMYNVDLKNVVPLEDPLRKFDGKADEGFSVRYSINCKAFRVFNSRTRIVQETLHTKFLENKPNVAGIGPKWLFNIETLTMCMNYQPVVAGNQPNENVGIKETLDAADDVADAAFDVKENENDAHVFANESDKTANQKHDEKAKRNDKGKSLVDSLTGVRDLRAKFEEFSFNSSNRVNVVSAPVNDVGPNSTNNSNSFNTASPSVNAVRPNFEISRKSLFVDPSKYPDDPDMPELEDIVYSDDEEMFHGFKDPDYPDEVYKVVKALYGLHQAPRAWYETLANYLLENGFQRGKIDQTLFIKKKKGDILLVQVSVDYIIFGSTNMDDKFQISSIGELTFFLGLQVKQKDKGIIISQDKYVAEILRKSGFTDVKSASTPIETEKPLLKDPDVKRIFRYLKGKPHLGLWYPRDSPFNLVAYSDSDYAGANLYRKSTTGGCQFLVNAARHFISVVSYELMLFGLLKVAAVNLMMLVKKVNDDVQLCVLIDGKKVVVSEAIIRRDFYLDDTDGVECLPNVEFFKELARIGYEKPPPRLTFYKAIVRNVDSPSKFLMYPRFLQVVMDHQVDDMTTHNTRYTSPALTHKVFSYMRRVGKGFSGVKTPLFDYMMVQPQPQAEEDVEIPIAPAPPSTTSDPLLPDLQDPTPTPHAAPPQYQTLTPHDSPPQDQPTTPYESFMPLLTTLMEKCATLSQKVAELENDKHSQALEILQLKKRVKKLERKKKSKSSALKRLRRVGTTQRVESSTDTVLDVETDEEVVAMDAESQRRLNQEDVSAAEPTIFDDEDVTMMLAQTLIKPKAEKARILDEQIAQNLHDKEYDDKEENIDWSDVAKQVQERHLDSIRKYQNLKKKPVSIAQVRKNMIIYLKNMAGYKMEFFRGMTYDNVRPIFNREYKKVQTLFKPDKDVQETKKKRVDDETLLQESFKKLRAAEVSGSESTQEIPSNDPKVSKHVGNFEEGNEMARDLAKDNAVQDLRKMHKGITAAGSTLLQLV